VVEVAVRSEIIDGGPLQSGLLAHLFLLSSAGQAAKLANELPYTADLAPSRSPAMQQPMGVSSLSRAKFSNDAVKPLFRAVYFGHDGRIVQGDDPPRFRGSVNLTGTRPEAFHYLLGVGVIRNEEKAAGCGGPQLDRPVPQGGF